MSPIVAGFYVSAEQGGGLNGFERRDALIANRVAAHEWEQITVVRNQDGTVSFRCPNGQYVSAEGGGGGVLSTNRDAIGVWEMFTLIDGKVRCQDGVHFIRERTDHSLVADGAETNGITFRVLNDLPDAPTREAIGSFHCSFQGLRVRTEQFGELPWFEPVIGWLDLRQDREAVYDVKVAARDNCVNVAVSSQYAEPNQAYSNIPGRDFTNDLDALRALITEIITAGSSRGLPNGFYVLLMLAGDGTSTPSRTYNDPIGLTYGREWLMENFARIHAALSGASNGQPDLTPWIVYCPGYDGVVPAWGPAVYRYPSVVDEWLLHARSVIGADRHLGIELAAGAAHWGGEHGNYISEAGQCLDVVLSEFPFPMGPPDPPPPTGDRTRWDQVWQIVGRLNRPYNRPKEQPDDPNPPYYLDRGTPRGPFFYNAFEFDTFGWVRGFPEEQVQRHRQALRDLGCALVG